MKISFITTVLEEEEAIDAFLDSLLKQTKQPKELIVVDAGSRDLTVKKIKSFQKTHPTIMIRIIIVKRANRARGRNEAIKNAKGDIIVCCDVGCSLDKNWLKNITEPFKDPKIDVVAGYYKPITNNIFEKCLAAYTCVMPDRLDPKNFLPSSRSIAFKKIAWQKVGGYPENLDTCEDLVFAKKLKKAGFKFKIRKDAIVYWRQRKNLKEAALQFYRYAEGDGKALYIRPQTPFLFLRYLIGGGLLVIFLASKSLFILYTIYLILFLYLLWSVGKNFRYVRNHKAIFILPILQFTSDFAVMLGFLKGLSKK
ncbi:MAG: glycosyltransferase [Candidatus Levybacteria bacterium]|nr:glycosyltransferase [Candidatus Levybacteria bacterium]